MILLDILRNPKKPVGSKLIMNEIRCVIGNRVKYLSFNVNKNKNT